MPRIADASLEAIRQRVDIVELVREYVPSLRPAGRAHKACCPFHQEKTPSFHVNPERQIFHCFGCKEGGDIFSFVMKMERLTFSEAVAKLAQRAGVEIAPRDEELSPQERERGKVREALAFARGFYHDLLEKAPEADGARRYLDGRGLSPAMRERFGIGFCLADGASFLQAAVRKGYAPELLARAGLAAQREGAGKHRDYFRGRVMFPIVSVRGEVIGFGARAMGDYPPKYLNSPDTPVFSKGRVLYGLFEGLADVRKARRLLLLEGYMDVLAAHQFGLTLACAPLGTAVTPEHAALIKRYAEEVIFVFDPDNAGASAALRGAELLLEHGLAVRIATVPDGLDPDELLHRDGAAKFQECLDRAVDLPDFRVTLALAGRQGPLSPQEKANLAQEVLATVAKAPDDVLKREWVRRLAQRLGIDEESLASQLQRGERAPEPRRFPAAGAAPAAEPAVQLSASESAILQALFQQPALALEEGRLAEDDLASTAGRRILAALREVLKASGQGPAWSADLLKVLTPEDAALAGALLVEDRGVQDPAKALDRAVEDLRLLKRYREVHARVVSMDRGESPKDEALVAEYGKLLKTLSSRRLLDRLKA